MPLHSHIAFGCGGKSIYQWNIKNGETTIKKLVQDSNVLTIAANPKGMLIASADVQYANKYLGLAKERSCKYFAV